MNKRVSAYILVSVLALLVSSSSASAHLLPSLSGTSPGSPAGLTNFNYDVLVTEGEQADGALGIPAYFTIYDIAGFVSVVNTPAGWSASVANSGQTPLDASSNPVGVTDSSLLPNVTFTHTGGLITGPFTVSGFVISSTFPGISPTGQFSQQATKFGGLIGPVRDFGFGPLPVPFGQQETVDTPEPSAVGLMLTGLFAMAAGVRRKLQA